MTHDRYMRKQYAKLGLFGLYLVELVLLASLINPALWPYLLAACVVVIIGWFAFDEAVMLLICAAYFFGILHALFR